jgi:hypothetical protein
VRTSDDIKKVRIWVNEEALRRGSWCGDVLPRLSFQEGFAAQLRNAISRQHSTVLPSGPAWARVILFPNGSIQWVSKVRVKEPGNSEPVKDSSGKELLWNIPLVWLRLYQVSTMLEHFFLPKPSFFPFLSWCCSFHTPNCLICFWRPQPVIGQLS